MTLIKNVKNIAVAKTGRRDLNSGDSKAKMMSTIASGYKNIKTGTAYVMILFKPKFAIINDTIHKMKTYHL